MPDPDRSLLLEFDGASDDAIRADLSAVVRIGDDLWLASDEGSTLERLSPTGDGRYGAHARFALGDYVDLPDTDDDEVDVEGLDFADGVLWVTGSHSARRKKPEPDEHDVDEALERLATTPRDGARQLLLALPLVPACDGRSLEPAREGCGSDRARRLRGGRKKNALTKALRDDPHFARFLKTPGKDNGFNIEGLAVAGDRVFLGLRGPVLRGWAAVLEIAPEPDPDREARLRLREIGPDGAPYRKHFLDLRGLGLRDLCVQGDDLLLLAGPTMSLDGRAAIFRWSSACVADDPRFVGRDELPAVLELPYGRGLHEHVEHPEGITLVPDGDGGTALLVVYDSPDERRRPHDGAVRADVFPLPSP